jgi:hypothetical protein
MRVGNSCSFEWAGDNSGAAPSRTLYSRSYTSEPNNMRKNKIVSVYIYAEYRDNHLVGARNSMLAMFNGTHSPWYSMQERRREHGHAECRVVFEGYFYEKDSITTLQVPSPIKSRYDPNADTRV